MSIFKKIFFSIFLLSVLTTCQTDTKKANDDLNVEAKDDFQYLAEQFADVKIIRYQIPGWDELSLDQKKLTYYLYEAGLSGRDIIYDQNNSYNLRIRKSLENIVSNYDGDKENESWKNLVVYTKRIWFSNGIHHHYSYKKFEPGFNREYLTEIAAATDTEISEMLYQVIFDPNFLAKKVNKDAGVDLVAGSANNFYEGVTQAEVDAFYAAMKKEGDETPVSYGLNSKVVKENGQIKEKVWKIGGMYGSAIERIVYWLGKAIEVAENEDQKSALVLLKEFYETGDLEKFDDYNLAWIKDVNSTVDVINGFIEVYNDAMGYKGSFEAVVQIKDFDASERMSKLEENVQWFEDNSTIMDEHKKKNVTGVTYKVITVAAEAGDASPSTPIGINLPNANWIRVKGSKSVSLGNILDAYEGAAGEGLLEEFAYSDEEKERSVKYGTLAGKMHTALHEVVGHASGQINPGIGTPKETLKNYASTLEEGRADLVGLYFIMDPKMVELDLLPSGDVGKAEYDGYIRNGMMGQLRRLEFGDNIEEDHMRNRQLVAAWAYEKGLPENVIEKKVENGKTYFVVNDYDKLRELFGKLLRELQRIKSEGDFEAGKTLVETYGVKVDPELHKEVLARAEPLKLAPYGGFINPVLVPVTDDNGNITGVNVEYPDDFTHQMLYYSSHYSFLPDIN